MNKVSLIKLIDERIQMAKEPTINLSYEETEAFSAINETYAGNNIQKSKDTLEEIQLYLSQKTAKWLLDFLRQGEYYRARGSKRISFNDPDAESIVQQLRCIGIK